MLFILKEIKMKEIKNDLLRKAKGIKVDFRNYSTISEGSVGTTYTYNKEKKRIENRSYYIKNRERRLLEYKNYYEQNKEMISKKRKVRYLKRKQIKERNNPKEKKVRRVHTADQNKEIEYFRSEGGQCTSDPRDTDGMTKDPTTKNFSRSTENCTFDIDIHLDRDDRIGTQEDQDYLRPQTVNEERVIKNSNLNMKLHIYPNVKRFREELAQKHGLQILKRKTKYNKNKKYDENSSIEIEKNIYAGPVLRNGKFKAHQRDINDIFEGCYLENGHFFGWQRNKKKKLRYDNHAVLVPRNKNPEDKSVYNLEPSTDDFDNKTNKLDNLNKTKMKNKKTIPKETNKKDKDKKSKLLRNFEESAFLYNLALQTKKIDHRGDPMNRYNLNIPNFSLLLNTSGVMAVGTNKLDNQILSINQMVSNLSFFNCSTVGRNCGKTIENDMWLGNNAFGPNSLERSDNVVRKNLFSFNSSQTSLQFNHPYIFIPKRFMETEKEINNKQMTLPKNRIHEIQTKIRGRKPKTKKIEPDWTNPRYLHVKGICFGKDRKQIIKGYSKEYARTCEEIYIPKFYDKKN